MQTGFETQLDVTRRRYLGIGSAVGSGLVAGCLGSSTEPTNASEGEESTGGDDSYSVSIEPVGAVSFDGVPETWVAGNGTWADMGIALGLEPPEALWIPSRYPTRLYDSIDGEF